MKTMFFSLIATTLFLFSHPVTPALLEEGFVLIGDTGKDNQGQFDVGKSISRFCSNELCSYGMLAGDNVYPAGVTSENDLVLERMFDKYYNQLNFPFLVSLGNHDYGEKSNDWVRGSYHIQHSKKNPAYHFPTYYYVHETATAVFGVIDTSRLMWKKETSAQADMLAKAFEQAKATNKWFIVLGHHPYLSNGKHGNAGNYERLPFPYFVSGSNVQKFMENHVCNKAHFYFSGHDHSLQVFDGNIKGCNTQLVVSGTGASASKLFVRNKSDFESTKLGFFHVSIRPDAVKIRAIDSDTQVMFEKNYPKR